jgi:hypothetical protein
MEQRLKLTDPSYISEQMFDKVVARNSQTMLTIGEYVHRQWN